MGFLEPYESEGVIVTYQFQFIGEQECSYERVNAYESEYIYRAKVNILNPFTKLWEERVISSYDTPVSRKDVINYIDRLIEEQEWISARERKNKRKNELINCYNEDKSSMAGWALIELIDLLLDTSL